MQVAVTVLGSDRPGIVCDVSTLLAEAGCNIENVSQTVLHQEFAGIFLVTLPPGKDATTVEERLTSALAHKGLKISVQSVDESQSPGVSPMEPFVVVTIGQDKVGLVSAVTCVMKAYGVNINNMQFVSESASYPGQTVAIYEVEVPREQNLSEFVGALQTKAGEVGLELSVQHKRIFADTCRI
ncbi:MAG: ACT domain-containing protein [Desulfohalobiaceae bacterium]|nr:ACT domain-containing protein [Desulfohalobiaceae bacterium]